MPPKNRIDREQIVRGALELVRQGGETALNARAIAGALGCSTQPVFSHFRSMEELKGEVVRAASARYSDYTNTETTAGRYPPYKASGMAYIRFAGEEPALFRLLFMRDRTWETPAEDVSLDAIYDGLQATLNVDRETARLFHLEMWAVVHGIACMTVTGYCPLEEELTSRMLTDVFMALKQRFGEKE